MSSSTVRFRSFSSGSCGNCYLLQVTEDDGRSAMILVDAGVSLRRVKAEMALMGLDPDDIDAILVTHDHLDHIRALGSFCKKLGKPVWATEELIRALSHHTFTLDHIGAVRHCLAPEEWNEVVPGMVKARFFIVPHDATQTVGYAISLGSSDPYRFVIMTDIGKMTSEAIGFASMASTVVVESNYDMDMLMGGPYPHDLKMRICKGCGHLSNDESADAIRNFYHKGLRHIFLCHLSENNNTPEKARQCASQALLDVGADSSTELSVLPRRHPSGIFTLQR